MGFNMIFVLTDKTPLTVSEVAKGLQQIDPMFDIESDEYFVYDDELYGQVEVNEANHPFFADDIERFRDYAEEHSEQPNASKVLALLNAATAIFYTKAIWEDREREETLEKFEQLWDWFFENREGILFVDHEGFYDKDGLLLSTAEQSEAP